MINTLILGWEYPPYNSGGLGVACKHLCEALAAKGVNVSFLLPWKIEAKDGLVQFLFADEASPLTEYKPFMSGYLTLAEYQRLSAEEITIKDHDLAHKVLSYARQAAKVVKQKKFDVLHAHDWLTFKAGLAAREVAQVPLITHVHSTEYDRSGASSHGNAFCKMIEYQALHSADGVIANSHYTKNIIHQEYQVPLAQISVVHNGVDMGVYKREAEMPAIISLLKKNNYQCVLYFGRLSLHKGVDLFLRSAKKVLAHYPQAYFLVAGSGEQENELISLVADLGIAQRTLFTGFLRGKELQQVLSHVDVFVMPSISEPFGMTALEALAHKTPVIISKQSGVSEVLPNSLKVDCWDIEEMANNIIAVLKYSALKQELSDNGYQDTCKQTWSLAADKVLQVYQEVLNK